jgi:quercetin dioxygenase-like cupin family protein
VDIVQNVDALPWLPHPKAKGVKIKPLVSRKDTGLNVTCMLVQVPAGIEVPGHVHPDQADILFPLEGKARMWVAGCDGFDLQPGVIVRVPPNTPHKIYDVTQALLIYDVFQPALL